MEFLQVMKRLTAQYATDIPSSACDWAVSYDYHFSKRNFDALVTHSWGTNTLFLCEATRLAINDGALLGIEIGFRVEYRERIAA